ncbi:MAG: hypothetical protein GXP44_00815 [bacterium]|nr:hypothetical protein [bacterium]
MINQQILAYIKNALEGGQSLEEVKKSLMQMMEFNGWTEAEVEEALRQSQSQPIPEQQEAPEFTRVSDFSPAVHTKPKRHFGKTLAAVFLFVLFFGGASAYAYFYFFPSPEKVILEMFERQQKTDSFGYESKINIKTSSEKSGAANQVIEVKLAGKYDVRDEDNIKSLSFLDANISGGILGNLSLGLEARTLGGISYIKATDLPNLGFIDFSSINNKWIKIDVEEAAKQFGLSEELKKKEEEKKRTRDLLRNRADEVMKLAKEWEVVQSIEKLPGEIIDGHKTYHYKIIFNKDGLRDFFLGTLKMIKPDRKISMEELSALDIFFKNLEINDVEIWIGKSDKLLYGFFANFKVRKPDKKSAADFTFDIKFNDYGKPVDVKAPEGAKSLQEIFKQNSSFGKTSGLSSAREKARSAKRDADIRQLQFALRMYHDKYGNYPASLSQLSPEFIRKVPTDIASGSNYKYERQSNGKGYSLCSQTAEGQKCSFSL